MMEILKRMLPKIITLVLIGVYIVGTGSLPEGPEAHVAFEKAKVVTVTEERLQPDKNIEELNIGRQMVKIEILTGEKKGDVYQIQNNMSRLFNIECHEGDTIIAGVDLTGRAQYPASIYAYDRTPVVYTLLGLFFLVLIVFGRLQGLKTIVTLCITGICLVGGLMPMLFSGYSPVLSAILAISVITVTSFIWVSGWNKKSFGAIAGTLFGVLVSGIIATLAANAAHLLGLATEEGERLIYIAYDFNIQISGLLFAGILIASLGAIMDVAMSIASSVFEIDSHNKNLSAKGLIQSGLNVGRDIMGTMSNTLILAFVGGSLNLIIFIIAYGMPYTYFMNIDMVCTEVIQGLAGSIGIVLTVPFTASISAGLAKMK